ncbi:DUF192 domain-containing protein [Jannaschia donghaensis]|uniref:ACR n=1 Tax=Jannaschia donghaensis TaxID=420998 RepID=A0A0M6YK87_9RHOB|nr:DUF192 domain-containing protein [Jannaschia donghaensis]CTQ50778.1 hypothetical protein JDO7802_02807 [Jannaschia donghaensis]
MGILHGRLTRRALIGALTALLLLPGVAGAKTTSPICDENRVEVRGDFGSVRFKVELAMTPQEQAQGLMFRESLPRMAGMLFVYPRESSVSFWMRNTLIPLDMIFVDQTGTIVRVHSEAIPLDETPIPAGAPTLAVLEINGGLAARLGIDAGDQLRSPALPQDKAAWPCN